MKYFKPKLQNMLWIIFVAVAFYTWEKYSDSKNTESKKQKIENIQK